jgi:two-component system response regulator LytT
MNCIIIDDEMMARAIVAQFVTSQTKIKVAKEFPNAIEAIKYLNENHVDLVFLDIHMPDFTGFDFIKTLRKPPKIILVTSDKNFAFEAFEFDCIVDYLVKPISEERFNKAIEKLNTYHLVSESPSKTKVKTSIVDETNEFYINIGNRLIKIEIPSVSLVKANGDYIIIKTDTTTYTVHTTLKKIEDKLPPSLFLKVHRSYIINTKKIIDIKDNSLLIGKDVIPVSRGNRHELMDRLNLL